MHLQGKGKKTIARALSVSKNTVKEYIAKASQNPIAIAELLELEDPVLEAKLLPGNPAYKDARYDYLKEHFDYYSKELNKVGVNRVLLWEEYSHTTRIHIAMPSSVIICCSTVVALNHLW